MLFKKQLRPHVFALLHLCLLLVFVPVSSAIAGENTITDIQYSTLPGNRLQITLKMSDHAVKPLSFTIDKPARLVFDFANTASKLPRRSQSVGIGVAQSLIAISAKTKTRVILNVTEVVPFQVTTQGKNVLITLSNDASSTMFAGNTTATDNKEATDSNRFSGGTHSVKKIDFRRGANGEGRVIITLSDSHIPMDISKEFGKVVVKFIGTKLPAKLRQTLDVLDFATPVKSISSFEEDNNVRLEITPVNNNYEYIAYQTNNLFTIEFKPASKANIAKNKKAKFGYTGERLSLNFQDIPVRAVLQLIADFTGLNVVVSDSVKGNLTLRLKNVPWDQALDIILQAKGLSKRRSGNVLLIAPSEEIAAQEKIDMAARKSMNDIAPIHSAFFNINFAKVDEISNILTGNTGTGSSDNTDTTNNNTTGDNTNGILSDRGTLIVDKRTNTLIVKDTDKVISEVRRILERLDVPVRQVMISSRIVIATNSFTKELGSRFGVTRAQATSKGFGVTSGTFAGTDAIASSGLTNIAAGGSPEPFTIPTGVQAADRLNVNLATTGKAAGSIAFAILSGSSLIDLEISALQAENEGEIVSSPRVVTADRHKAHIEQGVEIPYLSAASSGATQVQFKKAVLSIEVTPQITPDDQVILDLSVNKDSVGQVFAGTPSIDTREVSTQVLVNNGDTVVLGGIYEQIKNHQITKVPLLGDIPVLGFLFRHTLKSNERRELLIFVTPKILKDTLSVSQ